MRSSRELPPLQMVYASHRPSVARESVVARPRSKITTEFFSRMLLGSPLIELTHCLRPDMKKSDMPAPLAHPGFQFLPAVPDWREGHRLRIGLVPAIWNGADEVYLSKARN